MLKAAVEGRLVPTEAELARQEGREFESGAELLDRTTLQPQGKSRRNAPDDVIPLPDRAPGGWTWCRLEQLASPVPYSITDGPFGSNLKTEHYQDSGPRVIRLQNIGDGDFLDALAHISEQRFQNLAKHQVRADDVVIAALGEELPRACVIPNYVGSAIVKADCMKFTPNSEATSAKFIILSLNSEPTRKRVGSAVHGVGRPRINLGTVRNIPVAIPPLAEQGRIVNEAERQLTTIENINRAITANLTRIDQMKQAVLMKAFTGQLTSSND